MPCYSTANAAVHNYLLKAEMKLDSFSERMESFNTRIDLFQTRCEQAENERRQSESRMKLALDTALGEIRRVEDTVGASICRVENAIVESNNKFERAFSIVTKDIEMLRSRQDMIICEAGCPAVYTGRRNPLSESDFSLVQLSIHGTIQTSIHMVSSTNHE